MEERRIDSKGTPFEFSTCVLGTKEYAKITNEINTNYRLYKDSAYCIHSSVGDDGHYYLYFFENHGFNDYNIVEKLEF